MLSKFSFCRYFRGCFFFSQPPSRFRRREGVCRTLSCQYRMGSHEKTVSRSPPEALDRSRSALGLSPPVVVDDGLDADEQVASKTDCTNDARILEAWHYEHDLRNRSWEQVVGSSFACLSDDRLVCKFGTSMIPPSNWGSHVESRRFSSRLVQQVCEKEKLEPGDKVF